MHKLRKYKKEYEYSYALGVFPVIEALKHIPQSIEQIIISEDRITDNSITKIVDLAKAKNIPISVNSSKIKLLAPKENTYCLAIFQKSQAKISSEENHLVLVNPTNSGNMGMIIRTMVAFGLNNLAIIKPAVDVDDPKVITSSVGSIFQLKISHFNTLKEYIDKFNLNQQRKIFTFALDKSAKQLQNASVGIQENELFSIVFGNEAHGLSEKDANLGQKIFIPQTRAVDSLNLSTAVAMVIWEIYRKR